jgi:hypothetical protein
MLIDMPTTPVAAEIEWTLDLPSQANRPEFGRGRGRTNILAGGARWSAKITMPEMLNEAAFRPWRSFLARVRGRANSFRVVAVENPQIDSFVQVVVDGAGQQGYALKTRGWQPGLQLRDGMFVTVGDRLLVVAGNTNVVGADGRPTINVEPLIPDALADGAPVEVYRPYAVLQMADTRAGYTVGRGQMYAVSFQAEEL